MSQTKVNGLESSNGIQQEVVLPSKQEFLHQTFHEADLNRQDFAHSVEQETMNSRPEIRIAQPVDSGLIASMGRKAFTDSFGPYNTPDDLKRHLDSTYSADRIESEMAKGCLYLIAEVDQGSAGFGKLRKSDAPAAIPGKSPIEIHQLYLLSEYRRRGVGSALIQHLGSEAIKMGGDGIFLGVWEKADWAISFYLNSGMREVGKHLFRVGSDDQTDLLMYKSLE